MSEPPIRTRKDDHLRIVCEEDVAFRSGTLLGDVRLAPDALPELAESGLDTRATLFGQTLPFPLMITSMTGGGGAGADGRVRDWNRDLATVAAETGVALALGSQRVLLKHPEAVSDFRVRALVPDGLLLGNIGGQQVVEYGVDRVAELVAMIEADGICVHLNAAHELAQPEGDRDFTGILDGIAGLVERLEGRVLVKEVGSGLGPATVVRLQSIGVRAVDVAGAGGTSWTKVNPSRAEPGPDRRFAEGLADWGMPTAACVLLARRTAGSELTLVGAGGIRTGTDVAHAIALGADLTGMAREILLALSAGGVVGAVDRLREIERTLRAIMLLTGSPDLPALRHTPRILTGELARWAESPPD